MIWAKFGPYFTKRYNTPWGMAVDFNDTDSNGVRDCRVYLIAESDLNDPRLIRSPEPGGFGLDA